jgi:hypothetical protein
MSILKSEVVQLTVSTGNILQKLRSYSRFTVSNNNVNASCEHVHPNSRRWVLITMMLTVTQNWSREVDAADPVLGSLSPCVFCNIRNVTHKRRCEV